MTNHQPTVLAIVPGSRYVGFAILCGRELKDWGIRVVKRRTPEEKLNYGNKLLASLLEEWRPNVLAIKNLHPSRSSASLNQLAGAMTNLARSMGLRVCRYPLERVEAGLCGTGKASKAKLAARICEAYPFLSRELERERTSRNPYHTRMFEAVALALTCLRELESPDS